MKGAWIFGLVFLLLAFPVFAQQPPEAVQVNLSESRSIAGSGLAVSAQAGNVTQLIINGTRVTSHWQGYYGTVTGFITLDDGINNTIFDWKLANPLGEIYAANHSSITWANITCVNLTALANGSGSRSRVNGTILEDSFNIPYTDADGINETFNWTYGSTFTTGTTTIDSTYNCPLLYTYVNNASQQSFFREVLLTDNLSVIFTSILEQDRTGYDGRAWDFQMIVPENSAVGTTPFYFFVELS